MKVCAESMFMERPASGYLLRSDGVAGVHVLAQLDIDLLQIICTVLCGCAALLCHSDLALQPPLLLLQLCASSLPGKQYLSETAENSSFLATCSIA